MKFLFLVFVVFGFLVILGNFDGGGEMRVGVRNISRFGDFGDR